jgi:hypothetical protein
MDEHEPARPDHPDDPRGLPHADRAWIPEGKLEGYLLSDRHRGGAPKAAFFRSLGYTRWNAEALADRLLALARSGEVRQRISTRFGIKYVVEGDLEGLLERNRWVRTIWVVEPGSPGPRLVTAYPIDPEPAGKGGHDEGT